MKLSILMPALESRSESCVVREQIKAQLVKGVEFLDLTDDGQMSSGQKRHNLTAMSSGDYISFVDDDDQVSENYVASILEAIESNPDVVTFNVQAEFRYPRKTETEVWHFGLHEDNRASFQMCANHLAAWKRSVAEKVAWCPSLGCGDDQLWYKPLLMAGLANSEVHIDQVLYYYFWNAQSTQNQTMKRVDAARRYFGKGLRCLVDDRGEIYIEDGYHHPSRPAMMVRNSRNQVLKVRRGHLRELGIVRFK